MTNYYTILKVSEEATADEIKLAYRALAKEFHPDINPNNIFAEEYFKKILEYRTEINEIEKIILKAIEEHKDIRCCSILY